MKVACAVRSQNLFRRICKVAESMKMVVNSSKTLLMCISDSRTDEASAGIEDAAGEKTTASNNMKIL